MTKKLCECGCGGLTSIAKRSHKSNGQIKGQPVRFIVGHNFKDQRTTEERFWDTVNKNGPIHPKLKTKCWLWAGSTRGCGYGQFWLNNKNYVAHRVAWFLAYGVWPNPCALHSCDNPPCVRLSHLFEGTTTTNNQDKSKKKRCNMPNGENVWNAKLTEKEVKQIRKMSSQGEIQRTIALKFGINQTNVSAIIRRKTWRELP